jgi:hypothetical protein
MALGGAGAVNDSGTFSALDNPAGPAYVFGPLFSVTFRNLPDRRSLVTGNLASPVTAAEDFYGRTTFTHYGYAIPMGAGALGLSYTLGGYYLETSAGSGLTEGGNAVLDYERSRKFQTDYFTAAFGRRSGPANLGLGLVIAHQYSRDLESYRVVQGTSTNEVSRGSSGSQYGAGVVAGIQRDYGQKLNLAASIRTPIELTGDAGAETLLPRLPGKASLGSPAEWIDPAAKTF